MILAGDVGGTKTHLALFEPNGSARTPLTQKKLPSQDFPSLEALVREFLGERPARPLRAVLGIAGPVVGNRVDATNLPWPEIDGQRLGEALGGVPVRLLNDLESTAWGLGLLEPGDLEVFQTGETGPGNRALIAAGTGLGESVLVREAQGYRPSPSEGGHTDFGPRDALEDELNVWLRARYGRVSYERILSGPGLADLYRFFSARRLGHEPGEVAERFTAAEDPAVVVTETGMDGSCERARLTLEKFAEIYGAEAGNLALKALAVGGVFVAGGIAPRILPILRQGGFMKAFRTKGRLSPLLERMPVHLVLDDKTALWGAADVALRGG